MAHCIKRNWQYSPTWVHTVAGCIFETVYKNNYLPF